MRSGVLDVRTVCRWVTLPGMAVVLAMYANNLRWENLWMLPGILVILAYSFLAHRLPSLTRLPLLLLGAATLGHGLTFGYDSRSAYMLLMFFLVLTSASVLGRSETSVASVAVTLSYVVARFLGLQARGMPYHWTTMATDALSFLLMGFLVFQLAEGQRQIRSLNRQLEDHSRQTETELQRTLEAVRDIVLTVDRTGTILTISPVCLEILGYAPAEMAGRRISEFIVPEDYPAARARFDRFLQGGELIGFEDRMLRKDGSVVWLEWNARLDAANGIIRCVARDITQRRQADHRLLESEQRYKSLYESNPDIVLVGTFEDGMIGANRAFKEVTGYDPDDLVSRKRETRFDLLFAGLPEDRARWRAYYEAAGSGRVQSTELSIAHRAGHQVDVEATFIPLVIQGQIEGVYVVAKDITQRRQAEVAQARLAAILEATPDFVSQFSPSADGLYLNAAARNLCSVETGTGTSLSDLFTPRALAMIEREAIPTAMEQGTWRGEAEWRTAAGETIPVSQVIVAHKAPDGTVEYLSTIARDISERKRFESELAHMAQHDMLTGLLNRRGFHDALAAHLPGEFGAVLFIDLDDFKYVNDSLGHLAGDDLLRNIARVLKRHLRQGDVMARFSGDEFIILLPRTAPAEAQTVGKALLEALRRRPILAGGEQVSITASIGVACFPEHGTTMEELMAHADRAMYQAKDKGRNVVAAYEPDEDWSNRVQLRMSWERRIRGALEGNGLVLFAQPILDLNANRISHYELLLRMADENGGLVGPGSFLHVAERFGLIYQIDRWVVKQAIHLLVRHEQEGRDLFLEVNLSGKALNDPELLGLIRRELNATGVAPHRLIFEVTETAAITDFDMAYEFINVLTGLGCRFALDDFGAGFSSFERLKRLPVDYLKLDGSFIRDLPSDEEDRHLVKAMVEVARSLGKRTIAEFVEDAATVAILIESGVDYAQGYHVGRPRPVTEIWPLQQREEATAE